MVIVLNQSDGESVPLASTDRRGSARGTHVRVTVRLMSRRCARPGCGQNADTTLSFDYSSRQVWLDELQPVDSPANHDLCRRHADRTQPPKGWALRDRRAAEAEIPVAESVEPVGLRYAS